MADFVENIIGLNGPFCRTWSRDLPTLKFKTWHFVNIRNEKSKKKNDVCSIEYKIWKQFLKCQKYKSDKRICMGKSCRRARPAIQQLFPIQILLPFPIFKLPPNFIFQCYRPQTWQSYLFFSCSFHFWCSQSARSQI